MFINISLQASFSHQSLLVIFHWSQSDRKSSQLSWTQQCGCLKWFRLFLWFLIPPVSFLCPWGLFLERPLLLVLPSPSCFTVLSAHLQDPNINLSFRVLSFPRCCQLEQQKPPSDKIFFLFFCFFFFVFCLFFVLGGLFFCQSTQGLVFWSGLGDSFFSQNPREVYASISLEQILLYTYTIW